MSASYSEKKPTVVYISYLEKDDQILHLFNNLGDLNLIPVYSKRELEEILQKIKVSGVIMGTLRVVEKAGKYEKNSYCATPLALVKTIKEIGLPLLVYSGADEKILNEASRSGADRVFQKPSSIEKLIEAVNHLFITRNI